MYKWQLNTINYYLKATKIKSMIKIIPCIKPSILTLFLMINCSQDLKCQTFYCAGKLLVLDSIWLLSETDNDNQGCSAA